MCLTIGWGYFPDNHLLCHLVFDFVSLLGINQGITIVLDLTEFALKYPNAPLVKFNIGLAGMPIVLHYHLRN